jgi:hypothetical protein
LNLSVFPNDYDIFNDKTELSASDIANFKRWQTLKVKTDRTNAESIELNSLTIALRGKLFFPDDLNILYHAMKNLQVFTKETFKNYFKYCDEWSLIVDYQIFNTVTYDGSVYMAYVKPNGALPTDASKWLKISSKGEKGEQGLSGADGINLIYKHVYNNTTTYGSDDLVTYNGSIYYCKQDGVVNILPTNTTYWELFMSGTGEDFDSLSTSARTSLVSAINEIYHSIMIDEFNTIETSESFTNIPSDCVNGIADVKFKGNTYWNRVINSNFVDISNWTGVGATLTATNNVLTISGNGTITSPKVEQVINVDFVPNKKIFIRCKLKSKSSSCINAYMQVSGSSTAGTVQKINQNAPYFDKEYIIYGLVTLPSNGAGKVKLSIGHDYADATTSNNKSIEIKEVLLLDLSYQKNLENLTSNQINKRVPEWFDGKKSVRKINITTSGKNIWGSLKAAQDIVGIVKSRSHAYLTTVDGREILALKGSDILTNKIIFNKFKENTQYTIQIYGKKSTNDLGGFFVIYYTDGSYDTLLPSSTTWNNIILTTAVDKSVSDIKLSYNTANAINYYDYNTFQIEEGNLNTEYKKYKEFAQNINQYTQLKSLPNGIFDSIENNVFIQRVSDPVTLDETKNWTKATSSYVNVDVYYTKILDGTTDYNGQYRVDIVNYKFISGTTLNFTDDLSAEFMSYNVDGSMAIFVKIPKNNDIVSYISLNKVRSVEYQLSNPIINKINIKPTYVEKNGIISNNLVICNTSVCSDGKISVSQYEPIYEVLWVEEVSSNNMLLKFIPLDELVLANDKLSFTIGDLLEEGKIYKYFYKYNGVLPTLEISYPINIKAQSNKNSEYLSIVNDDYELYKSTNDINLLNIESEIQSNSSSFNEKIQLEHTSIGEHRSGTAKALQGDIAIAPSPNPTNPGKLFVHTASIKPIVYIDTGSNWKAVTAIAPTFEIVVDTTISSISSLSTTSVSIPFVTGHNHFNFSVDCQTAVTYYGMPNNDSPQGLYVFLMTQGEGVLGTKSYSIVLVNKYNIGHSNINLQVVAMKNI